MYGRGGVFSKLSGLLVCQLPLIAQHSHKVRMSASHSSLTQALGASLHCLGLLLIVVLSVKRTRIPLRRCSHTAQNQRTLQLLSGLQGMSIKDVMFTRPVPNSALLRTVSRRGFSPGFVHFASAKGFESSAGTHYY